MATATRALPGSYSEMYPGRFLKADMLKGKKVTVTLTEIVGESLVGENNKAKDEWVVKIKERPLELVLNKTNATCLYRMFGSDPHGWLGKRITIYPTTTKFGRETLDCIRIWGSPDIGEDMEITVPQGRKKAWETVMHKTEAKATAGAPSTSTPEQAPAPAQNFTATEREAQIFLLLGWSEGVQASWLAANANLTTDQRVSKLEAELDK